MNTRLNTIVTFALVVVLSAGLAMAGRGGGGGGHGGGGGGGSRSGGGGGGYRGGAGGGGGGYHTPSFSAPRQSFSTSRPAQTSASRPSLQQNAGANRSAFTPSSQPGTGERPGIANTPTWDNRLNAGNRANVDNRANIGNRAYVANRPNIDNYGNSNRTNNFVRPTHADWNHGDWYHGDWHGNWNNSWYDRPVGWWGAGYWAGDVLASIPWSWGYWPYYNPYYVGPVVDGGATIDYSQPIVAAPMAVSPPGASSRSDRRATGDALARCGAECFHAGRL